MINNNKIILIRNYILSEMRKMSSRVRITGAEIEVESKKKNSSASNFRFKVLQQNKSKNTLLMRIVYSAYGVNGKYIVKSSEEELPTEEVNELFYSIAQHQDRK